MRYGGLGGFGGFTPTRYGTPKSGLVQSDDEFARKWEGLAPNRYLRGVTTTETQLVPGTDGYNAGAASSQQQAIFDEMTRKALLDAGAAPDAITDEVLADYQKSVGGMNTYFKNKGMAYADWGKPLDSQSSHIVKVNNSSQQINPAWEEWEAKYNQARGLRQENQQRQQQAYNSMTNNGAQNGVLPQFYDQPGFGQVSGTNSQFNADGGTQVGGVDNSWTSGAYNPSAGMNGAYNPTPYSAGTFKNPQWRL